MSITGNFFDKAAQSALSYAAFRHPDNSRSIDALGTFVKAKELPGGRFELTLQFGAVSMRAELTLADVAFLFDLPVARGAAGVSPLMAVSGKDAA